MKVRNIDNIPRETVEAAEKTERQVLIGSDVGPHFAMRRFIMQPGGGMPNHINTVEHEQYVLRGRAIIGIGAEEFVVERGDIVFIPAGTPHWYRAEGDETFEFLCMVPNLPDETKLVE